ncbi:MAG: aldo/keto reductase [Puniceicoccales bacterium]|jgi:predicted aldo/keto reductase-like oxidoreductase|nr:aldo/keto reductase [Puniceicoccales bacterium]
MNSKYNRREFLHTGVAGLATLAAVPLLAETDAAKPTPKNTEATPSPALTPVDTVRLGDSGLQVSRIAFGTGSVGYNKSSNQTRLGMDKFVALAHHAYSRGIRFFDMGDSYGSQPFVGQAIKTLPREKLTLMTKIWVEDDSKNKAGEIPKTIDRILKEVGVSYLDILILHCQMKGGWTQRRRQSLDAFSKAKQEGRVKAVGVSCHNWDALVEAVESPWTDVIMARINPFGQMMDNKPDVVKALLQKAIKNGKGVIAMKIFAEGKRIKDLEREQSIQYALQEVGVSCMTLGMESFAQVDDAVERVMRLRKK